MTVREPIFIIFRKGWRAPRPARYSAEGRCYYLIDSKAWTEITYVPLLETLNFGLSLTPSYEDGAGQS